MRLIKLLLLVFLPLFAGVARLLPLQTVIGQTGLSAPTGVIASDGAYNTNVGINWDTVRNATGYQIFRNTTNDSAAAVSLGTTVAGAFFDNTAVAGQNYFYWVRAVNGNTQSGLSAPDQGTRAIGGNPNGPPPLNPPPEPAGNPVTATKAWLGKTLFWDEQLSSTRTVSCGTCHHASSGGSDPRSITGDARALFAGVDGVSGNADDVIGSPGVPLNLANGTYQWSAVYGFKPQITGRRGMSTINAAYANSLFWDGRALPAFRDPVTNAVVLANGGALESQIAGPPVNPTEMAHTGRDWNDVAARVTASKPLALSPEIPAALTTWISARSYPELFAEAFGTSDITPTRIAMAIANYERTLYSDRTPADLNDLTPAEARGQQVFNQSRCDVCHRPILFTDDQFHNTGIRPAAEDSGLFAVTGNQNDQGKFRTPSLSNVELRAP